MMSEAKGPTRLPACLRAPPQGRVPWFFAEDVDEVAEACYEMDVVVVLVMIRSSRSDEVEVQDGVVGRKAGRMEGGRSGRTTT